MKPKRGTPLYLRILGWFALNLAVVGVVGWALFQKGFAFTLVPTTTSGEKFKEAAQRIAGDMDKTGITDWPKVLMDASRREHVVFVLADVRGLVIVGHHLPLPPQVHEGMFKPAPPPYLTEAGGRNELLEAPPLPGGGPGPPPRPRGSLDLERGPGPGPPPGAAGGLPPDQPPPPPGVLPDEWPYQAAPGAGPSDLNQIIKTSHPEHYWTACLIHPQGKYHETGAVLLANSESPNGHGLYFNLYPYYLAGLGLIALSLLLWVPFVRRVTGSLGRMQRVTRRMAEGDLSVRTHESRTDEIGALSGSIDQMAARLEGLVTGQKRFLRDVAHELSAPVARLQLATELLEERLPPEQKDDIRDLSEEVLIMGELVRGLLQFSRSTFSLEEARIETVNLLGVIQRAVHLECSDISQVSVSIPPGAAVQAVPDQLFRAVSNLVRNAIRYAGHSGPIELSVQEAEAGHWLLAIRDHGPGIPEEALPKIFEPFFRVDDSRSPGTGGTGLGLTIVRSAMEACGGRVTAENLPGGGLVVKLWLKPG